MPEARLASLRQVDLDALARNLVREVYSKHWYDLDALPPAYQLRCDDLRAEYRRRGQQLRLFEVESEPEAITATSIGIR
jgi:lipocalin